MEWLQLEATIASLTFEQLARSAETWVDDLPRQRARRRVIADLEFAHGRIASRWMRWADTFGLPHPSLTADPADILDHPYCLVDDDKVGIYVAGLLPVYDAALAILAGDHTPSADYELLSAPWRRACLPSRFTPTTLYGPHTQTALASLSSVCRFPRSCLTRMVRTRRSISTKDWDSAADTVYQATLKLGFPYRGKCLYWEAVASAETAMDQSPTYPELIHALWGYAAVQAFAGQLPTESEALLAAPYRAGGRTLPPV
ncbi:MAG: hypothetical protein JWQ81_1004 [Amycolatopsis sp.]|uniref:hypothetical protein n=1 Tax=Amycolatopsis sp. TaxID=37632 RepID=UPI002626E45A|nr:hypothetical protein [Amycolatopsis sp.]MCU1680265.1 hypothetical protein [Amycolatopsis sp.]